ncbi:SDR family NAD(P)-dependent oxidoreductase [Amycolatopsis sacchari]|uniref:NAD(P)-dependent dehydrogenase, short-chain alcohol dehydrogenase family n=1 Tax=Amycolatopsis sacchari TaxID=115433 RepID=A0A1I3VGJ2_9PSEU|nr:SDR family oxidoreductase [Amycolatopsis sacchari]SFJ94395.1 NAD(P)-dependent dehydrogenase, short-chain alcohol dehydrogenase family [Amycolatopsis sacchari]
MSTYLVTGGGTGIGAAVAARLADDGGDVVISGRRREPLEAVAAAHQRITAIPADAGNGSAMRKLVETVRERYGSLDGVVANAGGHGYDKVENTSDEAWQASLHANLTTAFVTVRESLPLLAASGGSVVIVSSLSGLRAAPETAGYTVGKHALLGLMRSIARDYGRRGVRANAVCPGWVRTPMADEEMAVLVREGGAADVESAYATVTKDVPLGRPAEAAEIAGVVAFLLGSDAAYVHGATLVVDGGAHVVDVPTLAFT